MYQSSFFKSAFHSYDCVEHLRGISAAKLSIGRDLSVVVSEDAVIMGSVDCAFRPGGNTVCKDRDGSISRLKIQKIA